MKAHVLANEWLHVEVAPVGEYGATRFDWTGIVKQVTLKPENHTFCVRENKDGEGTGGIGICNEFGIFEGIGYDDAAPGERFPKLGVGMLMKRAEEEYDFAAGYDNRPFDIQVRQGDDFLDYEVAPANCRGYRARLNKRLSIEQSALRIEYVLANVGDKPIRTHEYAHNFLGIDECPVGPDYQLKFSIPLSPDAEPTEYVSGEMAFTGSRVDWDRIPDKAFYYRMPNLAEPREVTWELIHKPSGAGVRETVNYPVSWVALWGARHVVSPELFIELDLAPGDVQGWTRTYEFFTAKNP